MRQRYTRFELRDVEVSVDYTIRAIRNDGVLIHYDYEGHDPAYDGHYRGDVLVLHRVLVTTARRQVQSPV